MGANEDQLVELRNHSLLLSRLYAQDDPEIDPDDAVMPAGERLARRALTAWRRARTPRRRRCRLRARAT